MTVCPGVVPTGEARHDVDVPRQEINDLSLSLITPLGPQDRGDRHTVHPAVYSRSCRREYSRGTVPGARCWGWGRRQRAAAYGTMSLVL